MNFQFQNALGGKVIASRSDLTRLRNAMTLLPNAKFEILPPPASPPPVTEKDEDDDDIMHDPEIQEMVENGEHTCHMFDAHCQACEDDEEDDDEEDDDEDDITLADLKEQLEDNMTLAEIQKELVKVEAAKKRLETIRLKKEKKEEEEEEVREWVDEATFAARSRDNMPNF